MICASPDYLRRRGEPHTPADLSDHDCIALEELQRYREWPFAGANGLQQVAIRARFSVNTAEGVIGGAVAGLGVARVLSYQAAANVHAGTLVQILSDYRPPPIPVQLVYVARQLQPLKLRAFLDFAAPRLRARLSGIA